MDTSSPFDALLPLLTAAQRIGVTVWGWPAQIEITFSSGAKVPLPIAPVQPSAVHAPAEFLPCATQIKILDALAGDATATKKQLAAKIGDRVYLKGKGGLDELLRAGLVEPLPAGRFGRSQLARDAFGSGDEETAHNDED